MNCRGNWLVFMAWTIVFKRRIHFWLTPTACLAQNTENKVCAERFMIYLMSDQADQIKKKHGYCQQAYFAFEDE